MAEIFSNIRQDRTLNESVECKQSRSSDCLDIKF